MQLNNYKFLKEDYLAVIENNNSLMGLKSNLIDHKSERVISFLKAEYHRSLFHQYSSKIAPKFDLVVGEKIFIVKLLIPSCCQDKESK